jgi:YD repeat-containing protein
MVDAEAGLWQYEYDAMGNLLREVDANGHADSFTYAHVYRLLSYTDAEDIVTLFSYKENGNRLTLTDGNGHTTTYTYDELDRLATVTNEEDETTSCRYDWMGNQTAMISADGVVTRYDYDPFYRLIRVTLNELAGEPETNDVNVGTNYGYDAVGNRTSLTYADGRVVMYGYYQNDWLQIVTEPEDNVTSYEQDVLGLMTCTNNPNSTVSDAIYAKANCMLTLVNQQVGGAIKTNRAFTYTYDEVGQRTEMVLSMRGAIRPSSLISTPMTRALSKRRSHDVVSIL